MTVPEPRPPRRHVWGIRLRLLIGFVAVGLAIGLLPSCAAAGRPRLRAPREGVPLVRPENLRPACAGVGVEGLVGSDDHELARALCRVHEVADERVGIAARGREAERDRAELLPTEIGADISKLPTAPLKFGGFPWAGNDSTSMVSSSVLR